MRIFQLAGASKGFSQKMMMIGAMRSKRRSGKAEGKRYEVGVSLPIHEVGGHIA
jgi:hypothetical protein